MSSKINSYRRVTASKNKSNSKRSLKGGSPSFFRSSPVGIVSSNESASSSFFQAKLTTGQPGDKYEREADGVADKVTAQENSGSISQHPAISPVQKADLKEEKEPVQKAAEVKEEEKPVQKEEKKEEEPIQKAEQQEEEKPVQKEEEKKEEESVQKKSSGVTQQDGASFVSEQLHSRSSNGSPLPNAVLGQMEQSFGTSFEHVKIHVDSNAEHMSKAIGAKAFTHGKDIYFNSGYFSPNSQSGKHLLAHELTHVVQQSGGKHPSTIFPQRRRRPAPIRRTTTEELLTRLLAPESPLWRQLNPNSDSPINCPATAAAVDQFLTTGVVAPAPSGDGLSSFSFSTAGMSGRINSFAGVRELLSRPNSYAVIRATRSAEFLRSNPVTPEHFFTAVNYQGNIILIDAYGSGQIIRDVNTLIEQQGFEYFNIFRGQFTVTHQAFDLDAIPGVE